MKPTPMKPRIIMARVEGSGTAATSVTVKSIKTTLKSGGGAPEGSVLNCALLRSRICKADIEKISRGCERNSGKSHKSRSGGKRTARCHLPA